MNNIEKNLYLSDINNVDYVLQLTDLAQDELESIVGRFTSRSHRAGQLRGEFLILFDGSYVIRHHFTKKQLWRSNDIQSN